MEKQMDLEAKLLKGSAIKLYGLEIKPLTIGEVVDDVGYERYVELLSLLLVNKNRVVHLLEDKLKNEIRNFDLFFFDEELMGKLIEFFKVFLKNDNVTFLKNMGEVIVLIDEKKVRINRDNYDDFWQIFCKMYWVVGEEKSQYNPANKQAEEFIKKLEEKKKQYAKINKDEKTLFDVISGVAWKSPNCNIFEIWNLTVYQLYDAYYRLEIIDECDKVFTGLYSGAIDKDKIKIKEYDWAKKIKIKKES